MTNRSIAHARLRNSRLVGSRLATPEDVVGWFGAVQSQDVPGALWAIAQRLPPGATIEGVGAAMDDGRLARTHALRPTWHFLVPADLRWIQALTGGRVQRAAGSNARRDGLDAAQVARAEDAIVQALADGRPRTRRELGAAIEAAGVDVHHGNRLAHIAAYAETDALIVNGPRRGAEPTYLLVDDRIAPAPPLDPAHALRELTIRYFRSHGPALAHDMAWWSGLTVTDVRRGIELAGDQLEECVIDDKRYVAARGGFEPADVPPSHVLLLSNYDEFLGSYTDYSPVFDEALPKARTVADVLGVHIVVRDGLVVGGWRRAIARDRVTVTATLLLRLTPPELDALEAAAAAFGRFLDLPVDLRILAA